MSYATGLKNSTATTEIVTWSPQQNAFLDFSVNGKGSCILQAVAGAGKSTTLVEAACRIANTGKTVAMMAFNKKIADELKDRVTARGYDWKQINAGTAHSFGFSAFKKRFPNFNAKYGVKTDKVSDIVAMLFLEDDTLKSFVGDLLKLVSLAKQSAIGVLCPLNDFNEWMDLVDHHDLFAMDDAGVDENGEPIEPPYVDLIEFAKKVLGISNKDVNTIDFDDMIYLPLLYKASFWGFDIVMVDEAQDTNAARRALTRAMLKKGGRVFAVGDKHQAIYGFTGADADSLDLIRKDFNAIELPLTITYRCPKAVVKFAQQWVSHIEAGDTAPEGVVSTAKMEDFFPTEEGKVATRAFLPTDAILCRNTKPLVELAFQLIRNRVACKVEGRDIGAGLKKLATRWKRIKSLTALSDKLDEYFEKRKVEFLAKKQEAKLQNLEDQVETLKVIINSVRANGKHDVADAVAFIDSLFADEVNGVLILSTIHRSKGREWNRVFWLDRAGTCPSKWARQAWQAEQEVNLQYVAATRAKNELVDLVVG